MLFLRSLLAALCLLAPPAAWALEGADSTLAESLELMLEGVETWRRGESEDDEDVAEDGALSYYLGELRARAWLAAHPEMFGSEAEQALSISSAVGQETIYHWAGGDPEGLAAILERVLAQDRADPDLSIPGDAMEQARAAYEDFRLQILDQADEIRARRIAAGVEVR